MDERHEQIQVGAGLQESRLNVELIGWLEKWGSWILTAVLIVVAAYVGWAKYSEYQVLKRDEAFEQYSAARGTAGPDGVLTGSPDNLLRVAAENAGRQAVPHLATLDAAEIFLACSRRGIRPGADVSNLKPEDELSAEEASRMLARSRDLFEQVRSRTSGDKTLAPFMLRAMWGVAVASLSAGDRDRARSLLKEIEATAERLGHSQQAEMARDRLARLDALAGPVALPRDADLPVVPGSTPQQLDVSVKGPDAVQLERMPEGWSPPGFDPDNPPQSFVIPPQAAPKQPASEDPPKTDEAGDKPKDE